MTPQPPGDAPGRRVPAAPWLSSVTAPWRFTVLLVCALAVASIWLATLQRIAFEREQAASAVMQSNANLAIAFEQQMFRTLKAAEQIAAFVREEYLRSGPDIPLQQWVQDDVIREEMFTIASVVDEAGNVAASSRPHAGLVNYADRDFFKAQRDERSDHLFVSPPVLGRITGRWQVPMSLRITRPDGSFGGVVVMSVDPSHLTDFYRQGRLGTQGLLEVSGLDGMVRARETGGQARFGMPAHAMPWMQRQAAVPEGSFVDSGQAGDGVARIVSYRTMRDYPLVLTVGTAYAQAMASAQQRRARYLSVAGGATAALVGGAGLLLWALARQRRVARALHANEALFRATFHQAAMGIVHITPQGHILRANEKYCHMLGYTSEELRTRSLFDLSEGPAREAARQFLAERLADHSHTLSPEIEKPYLRKDGSTLWVCEALSVVRGACGTPDLLVAVVQDITARKNLEARLAHDARHDALTGLPNRLLFQDRFTQVLDSARRHGWRAAVLYLDLDGFKAVNDLHGHAAGDLLLRQGAQRLQGCVRAEDTVSRFGGDEFGLVLTTADAVDDCAQVAAKVLHVLALPFDLDGVRVQVSASVGAALFPDHGDDIATLVARADSAMYAAKKAGKNRFCYYAPD